jgi:RimJ/RimL family protein N-acetyltransferase
VAIPLLLTPRLVLRAWCDDDLAPFAAMSADPEVMRFLPGPRDRAASDEVAARIQAHFDAHGFGLWVVETPELAFAGCIGLLRPSYHTHFTPCLEVGWRLARAAWGHGYATEGAQAALRFGFEVLGEREIVAMTVPANQASRRVMERLGMTRDPGDDFDHPRLADDDPLRRHVLYRLARAG